MKQFACLIVLIACCGAAPTPGVTWDPATLVLVQRGGAYGRMVRVGRAILCCFEHRGHVGFRRTDDDGQTWGPTVDVAGYVPGSAANAELLALPNGRLLFFYNGRPRDHRSPFTIQMSSSRDNGTTWTPAEKPLYTAGSTLGDGCYEPAAIVLPSGAVRLFFANEHGHAADHSQEIDAMDSADGGATWTPPECVTYRPGHRDGMPVPILAADGRSILLAIEDNGLLPHRSLLPAVIRLPLERGGTPDDGRDPDRRWSPAGNWPAHAYAGAPYLRQLPNGGPTVLACQPDVGHTGVQRMQVFVGDGSAHHFEQPSEPFPADAGRQAQWPGLFVKSDRVVTALVTTTIRGTPGLWAIDGRLGG